MRATPLRNSRSYLSLLYKRNLLVAEGRGVPFYTHGSLMLTAAVPKNDQGILVIPTRKICVWLAYESFFRGQALRHEA